MRDTRKLGIRPEDVSLSWKTSGDGQSAPTTRMYYFNTGMDSDADSGAATAYQLKTRQNSPSPPRTIVYWFTTHHLVQIHLQEIHLFIYPFGWMLCALLQIRVETDLAPLCNSYQLLGTKLERVQDLMLSIDRTTAVLIICYK